MITDRIDKIKKAIEEQLPNCEIDLRTMDNETERSFTLQIRVTIPLTFVMEIEHES
jgi:hypothetical protein